MLAFGQKGLTNISSKKIELIQSMKAYPILINPNNLQSNPTASGQRCCPLVFCCFLQFFVVSRRFLIDIYLQFVYNCLVGAGGICRFIKINKNKK